MSKRLADKIEDIYKLCNSSGQSPDFRTIVKVFWIILDNNLSLLDMAGIFTIALNGNRTGILDPAMFMQFINGVAKMKYPLGVEFAESLVDELRNARSVKLSGDAQTFARIMDQSCMKALLKSDSTLRRIFASFAGKRVRLGAGLTWNEVKTQSVGMEIDGFLSFAGSYSIVPNYLSVDKCEALIRETLRNYPLLSTMAASTPQIMYPQV